MKRTEHIKGTIRLKGDYGFLIIQSRPGLEPEEDLYVAPESLGSAMDGDLVLARKELRRGRMAAVVEKVIERVAEQVVGTIDIRGKERVLVCERATEPLTLEYPAGSPGRDQLKPGYRVIARISRYPTQYLPGQAVVVEVLGEAGDPAVELRASRIAHLVPKHFPGPVVEQAKNLPDAIPASEIGKRIDLRDRNVFTIDPTDARDFDDAISIEPSEVLPGGYRVGIHIADVAWYISEGSALDHEAYARATSVYLPGECIPMLPERLSNNLCSLVEGADRLTASVFVEFTADLTPERYSHARSIIRSKRRFTYDEVDAVLDSGRGDFVEELKLLEKIGRSLNEIRIRRGALDLELPEEKPVLDLAGRVIEVRRVERTWSHRLIEELMLLANEYVARALPKKNGLYRIHEPPTDMKLLQLRQFVTTLGRPVRNPNLRLIIEMFENHPARPIVEFMILRTMQEARYSHTNRGHFGLASECYTHFTSPIRRYPDLVVHRLLFGDKCARNLSETGQHTSRREREAMAAERDAVQIKLLEYAQAHLGDVREGLVDNVTRDGLFISLDFGPRGFLPALELQGGPFVFLRESRRLTGRRGGRSYKIGDRMEVRLASVDIASRTLWLRPPDEAGRERSGSGRHEPKRRGGGKFTKRNDAGPPRGRHGKPGRRKPMGRKGRRRR